MLLNTRHIAELIEKGDISEIKEALEKSMSPGSQTFEQALFKLFMDGKITQEEVHGERRLGDQHAVADQPGDRRRDHRPVRPVGHAGPAQAGRRARTRRKACCPPPAGASFSNFKIDMNA